MQGMVEASEQADGCRLDLAKLKKERVAVRNCNGRNLSPVFHRDL